MPTLAEGAKLLLIYNANFCTINNLIILFLCSLLPQMYYYFVALKLFN
jgi:hypothetical protein